jgi:hypothetical protein
MYITNIPCNEYDDYKLHQAVSKVFSNQKKTFFRMGNELRVISEYPAMDSQIKSKKFDMSPYTNGEVFSFIVKMNPVKKTRTQIYKETGNRRADRKYQALSHLKVDEFIQKRFFEAGARLIKYSKDIRGAEVVSKPGYKISLETVYVRGILEIIDENLFKKVLCYGFPGAGKAFGYNTLYIIL